MKNRKEKDYRAMFYFGIIFVSVGVVFTISVNPGIGAAFTGIGAIYMVIGGRNKDKWKK